MYEKRDIGGKIVEVIPAGSIREEKEYIGSLNCGCGGNFTMIQQEVYPAERLDLLNVRCGNCGAEKGIYFDISSFFGLRD